MAKRKPQTEVGPKVVRANVNYEHERREPFVSLYANDATVQVTPWDFRVIFGQIAGLNSNASSAVVVTELSEIRMSPQFAKRLALVLLGQIEHYEQAVGPISLPEEPR